MSAAVEGVIENSLSIGFSLCDYGQNSDFSPCEPYVKSIAKAVLKNGLPKGSLLNVNFPRASSFKGLKVCRQAVAKYEEEFDERVDPHGRKYYWMTGNFALYDKGEDTDEWALRSEARRVGKECVSTCSSRG